MLRQKEHHHPPNGQTYMEYALVISTIAFALFAMVPLIKRGIQALTLTVADQVGNQAQGDQLFDDRGHLIRSDVTTRVNTQQSEINYGTYSYNDLIQTESETHADLGYRDNAL